MLLWTHARAPWEDHASGRHWNCRCGLALVGRGILGWTLRIQMRRCRSCWRVPRSTLALPLVAVSTFWSRSSFRLLDAGSGWWPFAALSASAALAMQVPLAAIRPGSGASAAIVCTIAASG